MSSTAKLAIALSQCILLTWQASAASLTISRPEEAGLSAERLKRIRSVVQSHIDSKDFVGAVTLVARKGKVVHFEAQGATDLESGKPMRTDTLFRMASMTKPITAVAVLMMMEEGKLVLSDPVSKFIPEFKNPKVAMWNLPNDPRGAGVRIVSADREVTLQHILTHTAGLAVSTEGPAGEFYRKANLDPEQISLAEFSKRVGALPLNFQPAAAAVDCHHDPGACPPAGQQAVLGGADHRDLPDIGRSEPQHRGEHEVRPREAARRVVRAQRQVRDARGGTARRGGPHRRRRTARRAGRPWRPTRPPW